MQKRLHMAVVVGAILLCNSCSSRFPFAVCRFGSRIAFKIPPEKGWFTSSATRISSIAVYERGYPPTYYWDTEAPNEEGAPYLLVVYGAAIPGWKIDQPARSLPPNKELLVEMAGPRGASATETLNLQNYMLNCSDVPAGE